MSSERPSKHPKSRSVESMRLMAGALCLDFLNTRAFRAGTPREWLNGYADLLTFARRTEILSSSDLERLQARAAADPDEAEAVTAMARAWREALYRTVTAGNEGAALPGDLERLNRSFAEASANRGLEPSNEGFEWHWKADSVRLEQPLWIIALNAAELLVSGLSERVRLCPGHDCGWVFLDAGRGKPRRWCAMDLCGNRAKIKQFRARHA